jgi:broad specificity phosphatase PhoE
MMATVHLVRHGRASGGWDADPDPGLDDVGAAQATALAERLGPLGTGSGAGRELALVTSPMRRCRDTAAVLAARWGVVAQIEPLVTEIPSPEGVPFGQRVLWLREAMTRTWSDLGPRYTAYRDAVAGYVAGLTVETVIVSHFIAINAVIGACIGDDRLVIRSLDNTSVTIVEASDDGLTLVRGGDEADTLIR